MRSRQSVRLFTVALCGVALLRVSARAEEAYQITSADVTVVCPLTVGGSFEAKTTAVTGSLTPAGSVVKGALAIDLMKIETGISLRDRHLRNNYLEVQKGPEFAVAKFDNIKVERLPGRTTFRGTLMLHGTQREVSGTADVQQNGKGYKVEATFPILISSFQIPKPTYLGVGVSDEITVKVTLTAAGGAVTSTSNPQ
jgi:polyisoprenoid-binding protein YceI